MSMFDKYKTQTKKVKIKALDNQEIEIRNLTLAESEEFHKMIVSYPTADGQAVVDYSEIGNVKLRKVATAMVKPEMTIGELESLSSDAAEAIAEIAEAIESFETQGKTKKA